MGRFDEAIAEIKRAQELNPLHVLYMMDEGWFYYFQQQYDLAIKQGQKALEMYPNFFQGQWLLGSSYSLKGMHEEAIKVFQKKVDLLGGDPLSLTVG
jgi:tetratricopeptide (TPR) repeat protein